MTLGQLGMKHPSLAGMVAAIEARLSRVALHYRFSSEAAAFLHQCLCFVLQQKFSRLGQIDTNLLRPCANDQIMRPIFAKNRVTHNNWVSSWKPGRSVTYGKQNERQTPVGVEAKTLFG